VRTASRWLDQHRRWRRLVAEHPLRYLFLEVTRRCNYSCGYCGSSCSPGAGVNELSTRDWIEIVQQLAADFEPARVMVAVTGGEPLLKRDLLELCGVLRDHGFPHGLVTNGFYLDRARARELVAVGVGSISVSLDAPPPLNDELRASGSSERAEAALCALHEVGFRGQLEVISTITRPALETLEPMRRYLAALRVPYWRLAPVMPIGRAAARPDLLPAAEGIRQLLEFIAASRKDRRLPGPEFCEEGYLGDEFEGVVRPYLCQCRAGVTTGGILARGQIAACPELGEAFVQGDIHSETFRDVWETRYEDLRDRSWTRAGVCGDCGSFDRCQGGSLHLYEHPGAPLLRCLYRQLQQSHP
jgi:radical SAM protein with 4Fe4S-binding SPASM domain